MTLDLLGSITQEDSTKEQGNKLAKAWNEYKHTGKNALLRTLFSLHKWTIIITIITLSFEVVNDNLSIYVLKEVMSYIEGEYDDINRALAFVFVMSLTAVVSKSLAISREKLDLERRNVTHGIQSLIFSKIFDVTSSSNKKYRKGELNGLVNSDPRRISNFLKQSCELITIPFAIVSIIFSLYQIIGMVTIYAMIILIAASIGIIYLSKLNSKLQQIMRRHDDERGNVLLEVIENIKVIKMNS